MHATTTVYRGAHLHFREDILQSRGSTSAPQRKGWFLPRKKESTNPPDDGARVSINPMAVSAVTKTLFGKIKKIERYGISCWLVPPSGLTPVGQRADVDVFVDTPTQ